jgi:hypothetical protein
MIIECEISLGELVDKLSILQIKLQKITDSKKLELVKNEEEKLAATVTSLKLPGIEKHLEQLIEVNLKLWIIEDDIRDLERQKDFGPGFIELARQVYITNDERFKRKNAINTIYQSGLKEVKSYKDY